MTYRPGTGPWWRAYALYRAWQLDGVWERIETALVAQADAAGKIGWRVSVDSTTCRAHVHAATVDAACGMLARLITAGQAADAPMMIPVLE